MNGVPCICIIGSDVSNKLDDHWTHVVATFNGQIYVNGTRTAIANVSKSLKGKI